MFSYKSLLSVNIFIKHCFKFLANSVALSFLGLSTGCELCFYTFLYI